MTIFTPEVMAEVEKKVGQADFYSDLTDEERAEEGLPPREQAKPAETAPGETPPPAVPQPKPEETPETAPPDETTPDETPDDDERVDRLFEELQGLRDDLNASLGKTEPANAEPPKDEFIEAALEHEDPVVRGLAERLRDTKKELEVLQAKDREATLDRLEEQADEEIAAVKAELTIGGKPMTEKQVDTVIKYMDQHPGGKFFTFEEATHRVFPDAEKAPKAPPKPSPARGPDGKFAAVEGQPVATILTDGSPGGGAEKPWEPRPNETMQSAIHAAGKRFGWVR